VGYTGAASFNGIPGVPLHSAMAADLGLPLQQVDIDKSHFPKAISDPIAKANEIQDEFLRVLKKTDSLVVQPLPAPPPPGGRQAGQ
jgi:hypothetical protein